MKRRDFLKFLGTVPFGIKALELFDLDIEKSDTSIEEVTRFELGYDTFNIVDDPGIYSSASSCFIVTSASGPGPIVGYFYDPD